MRWSRCWRQNAAGIWWQSGYNEKFWVVRCRNKCLPILGQLWSFAVFHSYEYPRFEQSSWSNRIAGVLSSNCTVTNRSRSWTKTCAYSFICTAPVCGKSLMGCWTFSKYPLRISLLSVVHWSSRIHNKHTIFCVSGACTRTKFNVRLELAYFLTKFHTTLLVQSACREVSSSGCSSKTGAQGFRSWGSPFWMMPPSLPFCFPNSILYQATFCRVEFIGSASWETQPWTFFQTCNHDTRDDVDNHTTIFFIFPAIDKEFWALVAGLAFILFKLFRQSVSSLSVLKSMLAVGENFSRISTSFHVVLTVSRGVHV